jgi:ribonuclease HII
MPDLEIESKFFGRVVGADEVGYGALCGPVVVGVVLLDISKDLSYIRDSKLMSVSQRERAYSRIVTEHTYSIGIASSEEVDCFNVRGATTFAYVRAIENLSFTPDVCLIDGTIKVGDGINVVGGDRKSISIAAASIIAKVFRDSIMKLLHLDYPRYMWLCNKGYGTAAHIDAIKSFGSTHHHRSTFLKKVPRGTFIPFLPQKIL